ncbi:unnamed protein product, partial [Ectocarpus fasciculatus]
MRLYLDHTFPMSIPALLTTCVLLIGSSAFAAAAATTPIDLGSAADFAILAGSTVTSTGVIGTVVTGDLGVYPGTAVTGFPPAVLNGVQQLANGVSLAAQSDLTIAYNAAAGLAFNTTLSNVDLGGLTLTPGVYKFDAQAALTGDLTLDAQGDEKATWVFQIGSETVPCASPVISGMPNFIYWQVGSSAAISKNANIMGNILADQSISVKGKAAVMGRLLARIAAVTLDDNVVTKTNSVNATNNGDTFSDDDGNSDDNGGGSDTKLSDGAIAGIVIGAV